MLGPLGYSQKLHSLSIKMLNFPSLFILGVARPHFDLYEILLIFSSFRVRPLVALRQWIASCYSLRAENGLSSGVQKSNVSALNRAVLIGIIQYFFTQEYFPARIDGFLYGSLFQKSPKKALERVI